MYISVEFNQILFVIPREVMGSRMKSKDPMLANITTGMKGNSN